MISSINGIRLRRLLILFVLAGSMSLSGQSPTLTNFYNDYLTAKRRDPSYFERFDGSPYENSKFTTGLVYISGQHEPLQARMRYNNCFDEMEFIPEKDTAEFLILDNKDKVDSIILNSEKFCYLPYLKNEVISRGFLMLLHEGKNGVNLYMRSPKEFQEEKPPTGGYMDYIPASFIDKPEDFYVQFENLDVIFLPRTKKKIIDLFEENGFFPVNSSKLTYKRESLVAFFRANF